VSQRKAGRWPVMAATIGMMVASVLPIIWIEAQPRDGGDVAAVFAPWATRESAFAGVVAAGGLVVREGTLDTILVVHGGNPGLIGRLYAAGAWAVIDPVAFGGCLVKGASAVN
jgi:hypothetical protein